MTTPALAIVGMACQYPDANSPTELWENTLAQRRAFRRIPAQRLRLEDYYAEDRAISDSIYITQAAVLKDYDFDRVKFHVAGTTFRAADLVHWLALDVADRALADAGFPDGAGLDRETSGVILGNTLTGEFSRANQMRLRWPYVRRTVEAALVNEGWPAEQRRDFLLKLETDYKAPFPTLNEESLAGGLSNTIAGRICNYFDFKGGGYTVDGACASSLLAVTTACSALVSGDLDLALAGGVDLSLDPFELVGFARTSALAPEKMRIYDKRSAGFWPGEGCGFVVLMRQADALAQGCRIYAVIRGWGVSSDGSGGITRPEVDGQRLALTRAYRRAGFGIDSVTYFEGHGTGTAVGDATELQTLSQARREADPNAPPAIIGSMKANIGHTKAAAGVAGLIKTIMALHTGIIPPTTGTEEPHPELTGDAPALKTLATGQAWPTDRSVRAGVSAMGFGGINTHLVLEGRSISQGQRTLALADQMLLASAQDAELFLFNAPDVAGLQQQVERLLVFAGQLSLAELTDLAAQLQQTLSRGQTRAAIVAATPIELESRLEKLQSWLSGGDSDHLDTQAGVFLGRGRKAPRVGFLFPGQGSPSHLDGGALVRRFSFISGLYAQANLARNGYDEVATIVAQPAIVTASLASLRVLDRLGIQAEIGVGHSLGELTALFWAGAMDETALLRLATVRGKAMMELGQPTGTMASIRADREQVAGLLNGETVSIACLNTPRQTVISGPATEVATVVARAKTQGLEARQIAVSHAFHSPLVAAAAGPLADYLAGQDFCPLQRTVVSTVTGTSLGPDANLRDLLYRQVTDPVRFTEAMDDAVGAVDLWLEVGPGRVLSGLAAEFVEAPLIPVDAGGQSLRGLLQAAGAIFALGGPVQPAALFADRFSRPFDLNWQPNFLANPCEAAPLPDGSTAHNWVVPPPSVISFPEDGAETPANDDQPDDVLSLVRRLLADRLELPLAAVRDEARLLADLHLNSITVSQIVAEAARQLQLPVPVSPTDFANVTVAEVAEALEQIALSDHSAEAELFPPGVDSWVRCFSPEWLERPLPQGRASTEPPAWQVFSPPDHPWGDSLAQAFAQTGGQGIVVCLPPEPTESHLSLLLEGAHAALDLPEQTARLVLIQHGGGGAAFARTFHAEAPHIPTCVVDVPPEQDQALAWVTAEALAAGSGYSEARYDAAGRRWEPRFQPLPLEEAAGEIPLGADDVLLVTGGGKGITAECALALARETGVRLALVGRSQPATDQELADNLARLAAAGVEFRYLAADVTDLAAVQRAVAEIKTGLGPVTAILHGAARNVPQRIGNLDEQSFRRTLAPKIQGMRNLLAAIRPDQLRLFVSFGSIIARIGLPGEADYGLANAWLADLTTRLHQDQPDCRCLTIDWSVWAGSGMGERLGILDNLIRQGISPIPLEAGVKMLSHLLRQKTLPPAVVVTGRFGTPNTVRLEKPELPFWRFLEEVKVYYPGVELVVEATLSSETDPYLADHVFQGERLFLAVLGLEAMAQVAMALAETEQTPVFENVQLNRPIVVPEGSTTTIRLAALRRESGQIEVVLHSQETAFQVDHFRTTCRFDYPAVAETVIVDPPLFPPLRLNPDQELYGKHFFHTGRFRRVQGYRQVTAQMMLAELSPADQAAWFSRYLPPQLVLGDPGARDATIHAIQVCVPQATLLPISVERVVPGEARNVEEPRYVRARERPAEATADSLIFDVVVTGQDGSIQEQWQGLRLKMMAGTSFKGVWSPPLLGPYLERRLRELVPGATVTAVVTRNPDPDDRQTRSDLAIQRALGAAVPVKRRPDGKPEGPADRAVSAAHAGSLTLAVAGPQAQGSLGCDLEPVAARPEMVWQDLLGPDRFKLAGVVADTNGEDQATATTRIWAAAESLKKAGAAVDTPLTLATIGDDGWVVFEAGSRLIVTYVAQVQTAADPLVLAVALERQAEYVERST